MGKKLVLGSIFGCIIVYVWMMVSWMVFPWHCTTLHSFSNPSVVEKTILEEAKTDGVYVIPNICLGDEATKGPMIVAAVKKEGFDPTNAAPYIIGVIIQLISAFLITLLTLFAALKSYWGRIGFITLIGVVIGISGFSMWNWMGFSFSYTLLGFVDSVIGWFLASLAIAACCRPKAA